MLSYRCGLIAVIIRTFSGFAHYKMIKVSNCLNLSGIPTPKTCYDLSTKGKPVNKTLCLAIAALLGLGACSAERVSHFPSYKLKIIQGNQLDARAVASLQPGMSRDQVQLMLGTPLLRDPFHNDRWDYTFSTSRNGVIQEQRTLTLYFDNDRLARAEGNAIEYAIQQLQAEGVIQQQAQQPESK